MEVGGGYGGGWGLWRWAGPYMLTEDLARATVRGLVCLLSPYVDRLSVVCLLLHVSLDFLIKCAQLVCMHDYSTCKL